MSRRLLSLLFHFILGAALALSPKAHGAETEAEDPAEELRLKLRVLDDAGVKILFEKLHGDDFDQREHAMQQLVMRGPEMLKLIDKYLSGKSPQIVGLAAQLQQRILCSYDGYFPTDPALLERLKQKAHFNLNLSPTLLMKQFSDTLKFPVVYETGFTLPTEWQPFVREGQPELTLEYIVNYFESMGIHLIPRGNVMLVASQATIEKVGSQRQVFDWSELQLSRDEAARVGEALRVFFPGNGTDITPSTETLTVRGEEQSIPRAARLLALLKPGSSSQQWPRVKSAALEEALSRISKHSKLVLSAEDPVNAIEILNKAGHTVFASSLEDSQLRKEAPYPGDLRAAAPIRLVLNEQPLGFALRWIQRRTRFTTELQNNAVLAYDLDAEGHALLRVRMKDESPLTQSLLGLDAGFLYPKNVRPNAAADADVKKKILETLAPHLEILPALDEKNVVVLRGRLLVQGSPGTLYFLNKWLTEWRTSGQPPKPPAWHASVDSKLNTELDWDGRRMTASVVIPALRKMGKIDILIEDAPDGTAASFQLTAQDAQLLPPGKHTLRALLDELARRADALWRLDTGVIVLQPKPAKP